MIIVQSLPRNKSQITKKFIYRTTFNSDLQQPLSFCVLKNEENIQCFQLLVGTNYILLFYFY